MRRIFGPVNKYDKWKYKTNTEHRDRGGDTTQPFFQEIRRERLGWLGNLARMEDRSMVKMMFIGNPGGRRGDGRHGKRWHDNMQGDLIHVGDRSVGQGLPRGRRRL